MVESVLLACAIAAPGAEGGKPMALQLRSSAFDPNGSIPTRHTCDGPDVSPALSWTGVPEGTNSLSLIMDDPDAPAGTWVHWVLYDLQPGTKELAEGVPKDGQLSSGARQGRNDFRKLGYGGPCPPPGRPHRYVFKLYALDAPTRLGPGMTKADLEAAMRGHVLAQAELIGVYKR
jgi:hypothetical protein